jgi:hypothetical protein
MSHFTAPVRSFLPFLPRSRRANFLSRERGVRGPLSNPKPPPRADLPVGREIRRWHCWSNQGHRHIARAAALSSVGRGTCFFCFGARLFPFCGRARRLIGALKGPFDPTGRLRMTPGLDMVAATTSGWSLCFAAPWWKRFRAPHLQGRLHRRRRYRQIEEAQRRLIGLEFSHRQPAQLFQSSCVSRRNGAPCGPAGRNDDRVLQISPRKPGWRWGASPHCGC